MLPSGSRWDVKIKNQNRLTKRRISLLATKFLSRRTPCCLLRFSRWHNARVIIWHFRCPKCLQQSALRSLAIVCDYMETTLFSIVCDLWSAIVCDRLRSYGNQPLLFTELSSVFYFLTRCINSFLPGNPKSKANVSDSWLFDLFA